MIIFEKTLPFMRYFIIILMLSFPEILLSQSQDIKFKHYTTANGLSQSWIRCIYQDSIGYIWFGTADGLNRFDGMEFKIYQPNISNPQSLGNGSVNVIKYKNTHEFWIGTDQGVYIYNRITDSFKPFKFLRYLTINVINTESTGQTWFGTNEGLYCFNPTDSTLQSFQYISNDYKSLSNNTVRAIYIDSKQALWIGTVEGLNKFDQSSRTFQRYYHKTIGNLPEQNTIQSIIEDKYGRLWVGTAQHSLDILNPSVTDPMQDPFTFVMNGSVYCLLIDSHNVLWIGRGSGEGLDILDLNTFKIDQKPETTHFQASPNFDWNISDNSVLALFEDNAKDMWVGTFGGGINYYSRRSKKFTSERQTLNLNQSISHNLVNTFLEEDKYLWIGTEGGLDRIDKKNGEYSHFYTSRDKTNLSGNAIYALYKDARGNLWYGAWAGGLNKFNYKTQSFQNFIADGKPGSLSNSNVFAINEDKFGNLWIGTIGGGINIYDYKTEKFTQYINIPGDSTSLHHNSVNNILLTQKGDLFLSVFTSLDQFDYQTKTFTHHIHNPNNPKSINNGSINSVFEDSRENIWVATSMGLELFDKKSGTFKHYTKKDGLPSNYIQGILEDNDNNLWISTNNGLTKFIKGALKPKKAEFHNYTLKDGLPGNEFSVRSAHKNKEGKMYFGTSSGYTYFYPNDIEDDPIAPKIIITDFILLNNTPENKLKEAINMLNTNSSQELNLTYSQSDFTIKYAALNFLSPTNNNFRYMLDGYEKKWHYVENKREATYTNIQPGSYTFIIEGSNSDGVWAPVPALVKITIHPPWWATLPFKIATALLIVFIIVAGYWFRFRFVEVQKQKLEKTVAERTEELVSINALLEQRQEEITIQNEELSRHRNNLEKMITERTSELESAKSKAEESDRLKSAFLANMSHEIRTPMNAIVGFASLLHSLEFSDEEKRTFIETINKNSETLLVLIDDILDISIIESNQLKLSKRKFDIATTLAEIESYYLLKNKKDIKIQFQRNPNLVITNDPIRFRQIFNNLINNAIKYTDYGHILFGYQAIENEVRFYVSDTGIGIALENQENIFNHFYKVEKDNDRLYRGTGIGLAICKKLVELMGGRIWVESKVSVGSTFYFTLPLNRQEIIKHINKKEVKQISNLKGIKILVAEDETDNFRLVESILKPFHPEIIWAKNGQEAVDIVYQCNFQEGNCIILMDIKMPVMNGIDAARLIKSSFQTIPVIAITAYALPEDKNIIQQENFDDYISKPFKKDELIGTISKYIV